MSYKHKKKYGQNFLNDNEILNRIIEVSNVKKDDFILEVGPGDGALTELLIDNAKHVLSVEVDKDLVPVLEKKFKSKDNFRLILKDILELDIKENIPEKAKVVANIPYYITSPIINKLIENRDIIDEIYIMIQKEVAHRIVAKAGVKDRSILTLAIEYFGISELLFYIPKEKFTPSPKVDSAFIKIELRKDKKYENIISEEKFMRFVKGAFSNKRKNILNNLKIMGYNKNSVKTIFDRENIDISKRAEDFTIDEFINMINILEKEMVK